MLCHPIRLVLYSPVSCNTKQRSAIQCNDSRYNTIHYSVTTVLLYTICFHTIMYCTRLYYIKQVMRGKSKHHDTQRDFVRLYPTLLDYTRTYYMMYSAMLYQTIRCHAILYYTVLNAFVLRNLSESFRPLYDNPAKAECSDALSSVLGSDPSQAY